MNLVLSTCLFETNCLPDLFPLLREAGFSQLEVMDRRDFGTNATVLNDLIQKSRVCDIEIPNWHLLTESPFRETDDTRKAAINRVKQSMDKGSQFGAKNHVLHWHHRFEDRSFDDLWRDIVDEWANHAESLGIRLLMETVPDKPSNERYVSSSQIADFVRRYPPEVLSMCVDVNHSNLREKLTDVVHVVNDRLVSLHVSDNDGHSEKHWLPGQGVIDFPSLFNSLEAVNFDGMIVLEVSAWCEEPCILPELKRLYEFGKTLLETKSPHPKTPSLANS